MNNKNHKRVFMKPKTQSGILKKRKGVLEMSFGWLFALVAGAVILFLAIYFSTKLISTQKETISAQTGTEIGILLDPLETSFESAQTTSMILPVETRIHNQCDDGGTFGKQIIQLDQKDLNKWTKTDVNVFFENKYIFSTDEVQGKQFYIFSKPFSFPFKVADLFYITSADDNYCFIDAPKEITNEINDLNQSNLITKNCSSDSIKVCFGNGNCDINVNDEIGYVEKNGTYMHFAGTEDDFGDALMYAAIFSDADVYECQLKRLMLRESELSLLYASNERITQPVGCDYTLSGELNTLSNLAANMNNSEGLEIMKIQVDVIDQDNSARTCRLW